MPDLELTPKTRVMVAQVANSYGVNEEVLVNLAVVATMCDLEAAERLIRLAQHLGVSSARDLEAKGW